MYMGVSYPNIHNINENLGNFCDKENAFQLLRTWDLILLI